MRSSGHLIQELTQDCCLGFCYDLETADSSIPCCGYSWYCCWLFDSNYGPEPGLDHGHTRVEVHEIGCHLSCHLGQPILGS